jgi:hypothetical protein
MKQLSLSSRILFILLIGSLWLGSGSVAVSASNTDTVLPEIVPQAGVTVFAVIGDYGYDSQPEADVAALVKSWNPEFIVTVGDNNYGSGAASTIDANIGKYYHDYIYPYKGSYGAGAAANKFFPALGNHDWIASDAQPYLDYFTLPGNERYYDFVKGSVHFFIVDSDPHEPHGNTASSQQAAWLKNGLAASASAFNLVITHHAPHSSGEHGSDDFIQWPFKAWGADAVLSGHDHTYERLKVGGLTYFVNGLGGKSLYGFGTIVPGSQVRYNQDYGAMRVEMTVTTLKFQFYTRTGQLIDTHTLSKGFPEVESILRAGDNPSNKETVNFTVVFTEPVTGVDKTDFTLTRTGVQGAAVTGVSGSGSTYTVNVASGSGNGTIRLDVKDDDSIKNISGNPLGGPGNGNGNFTSGQAYIIKKRLALSSQRLLDGWVLEKNEQSGQGGSLNRTANFFMLGDNPQDRQFRAILSFNTASLPDQAVITGVTLKICRQGMAGTNPFSTHDSLRVSIRKPRFGSLGQLQVSDFQAPADKGSVGAFGMTPLDNWYFVELSAAAFPFVNLTGLTQFRLQFVIDDNDDQGADYIKFFSGDASIENRPKLIVDYFVP